jgi:hypothetical protein
VSFCERTLPYLNGNYLVIVIQILQGRLIDNITVVRLSWPSHQRALEWERAKRILNSGYTQNTSMNIRVVYIADTGMRVYM